MRNGLAVFDSTMQKAQQWLTEIMAASGEEDRHVAYGGLRTALHGLRDSLTLEETVDLGAQLPMLIRGLYYEGWSPTKKPEKTSRAEFLAAMDQHFSHRPEPPDSEALARAVFSVLAEHVSSGEIRDVKAVLPRGLRDLWPE